MTSNIMLCELGLALGAGFAPTAGAERGKAVTEEDGGLRMAGLASGHAFARAQEILLKMRDAWVLHCKKC